MYQLLAYGANNAALATLVDTPAISDENFVQQNGHWLFYEPYMLVGMAAIGASLTQVQLFDSTWNSLNVPQVYPPIIGATIPQNPNVIDLRNQPITIPQNEQIACQMSNDLGVGNEQETLLLWIVPQSGITTQPMPPGPMGNMGRIKALANVTATLTQGVFSPDTPIALPNIIKGGTYCVTGIQVVCAQGIAFRVNFPRAPLFMGRKLNPGGLCTAAYGNVPALPGAQWLGPMGYFDTTELFQIAVLGATTVASATYQVFIDLIYMGANLIGQGGNLPS